MYGFAAEENGLEREEEEFIVASGAFFSKVSKTGLHSKKSLLTLRDQDIFHKQSLTSFSFAVLNRYPSFVRHVPVSECVKPETCFC